MSLLFYMLAFGSAIYVTDHSTCRRFHLLLKFSIRKKELKDLVCLRTCSCQSVQSICLFEVADPLPTVCKK